MNIRLKTNLEVETMLNELQSLLQLSSKNSDKTLSYSSLDLHYLSDLFVRYFLAHHIWLSDFQDVLFEYMMLIV